MLQKDRGFMAGIIAAIGTWIIIMAARQDILSNFPNANQYLLGGALLFAAWLITRWDK